MVGEICHKSLVTKEIQTCEWMLLISIHIVKLVLSPALMMVNASPDVEATLGKVWRCTRKLHCDKVAYRGYEIPYRCDKVAYRCDKVAYSYGRGMTGLTDVAAILKRRSHNTKANE
jgi:hypothetical protein